MAWQGKKYKFYRDENFQEYLKISGLNIVVRKLIPTQSPVIDLKEDTNGHFILTTQSTFRTLTSNFKPGQEMEEERMDGRKIKTIYKFDGENKFIQEILGNPSETIIREFSDAECQITLIRPEITCKRWFKAIN